jgi:hypothetical protein
MRSLQSPSLPSNNSFKPTPCRGVGRVLCATLARTRRPATGRLNSGVRPQTNNCQVLYEENHAHHLALSHYASGYSPSQHNRHGSAVSVLVLARIVDWHRVCRALRTCGMVLHAYIFGAPHYLGSHIGAENSL